LGYRAGALIVIAGPLRSSVTRQSIRKNYCRFVAIAPQSAISAIAPAISTL
jgi:hypothetical protein